MEVTLNFKEVELDIEFDYQPYERPVMYYSDGSGYPGCAEEFSITKISLIHGSQKIDITELCEVHFGEIEDAIREDTKRYRDEY